MCFGWGKAVWSWLSAFFVTQLVEVPIYHRAAPTRWGSKRLYVAFGASSLTHPIVFFVFPQIAFENYWTMVSAAEAFAVITEAAYLSRFGVVRPMTISLCANAASLGVGLLLRHWTGFP